jgi:phosphohistidine phosphatase
MELILWRHADAEGGEPDLLRVLTPLGQEQARQVAAWLAAHLPSDCLIMSSPAVRARQTLQALGRDYEVHNALGPGAGPAAVLRVAGWPDRGKPVLVVGHQPTLGRLAALLLSGREQDWNVTRAAVWWFVQCGPLDPYSLYLKAVITPELMLKNASAARLVKQTPPSAKG